MMRGPNRRPRGGYRHWSPYLEDAFPNFQHRNIERAAAQIVDRNLFILFLVQSVSERCRRRLVDDAQHFEAGDPSRILRRLSL